MTIQIGRVTSRVQCSLCPVSLKDGITEIGFTNGVGQSVVRLGLCPACLVTLEKLIKGERERARVDKLRPDQRLARS